MTMQHAAKLIGLLHRAVPHDLRRGAAAELDRHGRKLEGGAELTAQRALGHSEKAAAQGLTKDYIGSIREDTWKLRVTSGPIKLSRRDLEFATGETSYRPSPKLAPDAITAACEAQGLDPSLKSNRRRVSKKARDKDYDDWLHQQRALLDQDEVVAPAGGGSSTVKGDAVNSSSSFRLAPPVLSPAPVLASDHGGVGNDDEEDIPIDPALLELEAALVGDGDITQMLADGITVPPPAMPEGPPPAMLEGLEDDPCRMLTAERDEFSHFFATVNVRRFTRPNTPGFQKGLYGGSAEDPRLAKLQCPNKVFGCKFEFGAVLHLDIHLKSCRFTSAEYPASRPFACEEPGCDETFAKKADLQRHRRSQHDFKPQTCSEPDCTSTEVFTKRSALLDHVAQYHTGWTPQACPIPGCDRGESIYELRKSFQMHLKRKHAGQMDAEELAKYMPPAKRRVRPGEKDRHPALRNFKPQRCSHPGCRTEFVFVSFGQYFSHAKQLHGVSEEDEMLSLVLEDPPPPATLGDGSIEPRQCAYPNCQSRRLYTSLEAYFEHARRTHGIEDMEDLMMTTLVTSR
ncbi:hypothetical protein B0T24DRAFT_236165 [Lasiosphaeria ovina]|uniref:C2H2-type domain-containing protein n=1 Tax=Lasiosphaeria ovina TaxID=92902 RepID=A0AAE0KJJ7_9PEZI|nr:hypothetical protein B0T24DRAFT_236165 [Lasiosphaeria ovina]